MVALMQRSPPSVTRRIKDLKDLLDDLGRFHARGDPITADIASLLKREIEALVRALKPVA